MASGGRYTEALTAGRMAVGVFCALDGYSVSHLFASVGYDFVVIDLQHAAFTWPDVENMCFRIRSTGASVFLRTAGTTPDELNLALDMPVDGLILPNLTSYDQARAAVAETKFPPAGVRSLGNERHEAIRRAYDEPDAVIGMLVEHPGAVADIERIFSELAIEFAWVGMHDLAAAMGFDPHEVVEAVVAGGAVPPELQTAVDRVRDAARAHDVAFWWPGPGADATVAGVDARILRQAAIDVLTRTREHHGARVAPSEASQ